MISHNIREILSSLYYDWKENFVPDNWQIERKTWLLNKQTGLILFLLLRENATSNRIVKSQYGVGSDHDHHFMLSSMEQHAEK